MCRVEVREREPTWRMNGPATWRIMEGERSTGMRDQVRDLHIEKLPGKTTAQRNIKP